MEKMLKLERYKKNPVLAPIDNRWESKAVFNPAAILYKGKIHLFYRAQGEYENYLGRIGHAIYSPDLKLEQRDKEPVLEPKGHISYEDPRITKIGKTFFMTYVEIKNPCAPPDLREKVGLPFKPQRFIASTILTRLELKSENCFFHEHRKITKEHDRDVVLFPEKIGKKYIVLQRPLGLVGKKYKTEKASVWIARLGEKGKASGSKLLLKPAFWWEEKKVGMGPPPIKTKAGWLLIYHGVDSKNVYRAGVALLNKSLQVISRPKEPILEPEATYEKYGDVNNVVFPTASFVINDRFFVIYGAADKVCCVATVRLEKLLAYLNNSAFHVTHPPPITLSLL